MLILQYSAMTCRSCRRDRLASCRNVGPAPIRDARPHCDSKRKGHAPRSSTVARLGGVMSTKMLQSSAQRRAAARRRVLKSGLVAFGNRHCVVPCGVRDISHGGARLHVASTLNIPDRFELIIEMDGFEADCVVRWRSGQFIGVMLIGEPRQGNPRRQQVVTPFVPEAARSARKTRSEVTTGRPVPLSATPAPPTGLHDTVTMLPAIASPRRSYGGATAAPAPAAAGHDILVALLLAVQPEAFHACVLIAVSGAVSNALSQRETATDPRLLIRFYPRESAMLILASNRIGRVYGNSNLHRRFDAFHRALASAKQASLDYASAGFPCGDEGRQQRGMLADRWRAAAASGIVLLDEIGNLLAIHGVATLPRATGELLDLLRSVTTGAKPLLNAKGTIELPSWAERRSAERTRLGSAALLWISGKSWPVIVRDMSQLGAGLECRRELPVGLSVELEFGPLLRLNGVVAWSIDGRAGVHLDMPLHGANPSFDFCSRLDAASSSFTPFPSR